jgi:hypothetical protein
MLQCCTGLGGEPRLLDFVYPGGWTHGTAVWCCCPGGWKMVEPSSAQKFCVLALMVIGTSSRIEFTTCAPEIVAQELSLHPP